MKIKTRNGIKKQKIEAEVFPNHCHLSCINYQVDLGSFDVPMYRLLDYGLAVLRAMRDIEGERR